jgi:hypothetical protein
MGNFLIMCKLLTDSTPITQGLGHRPKEVSSQIHNYTLKRRISIRPKLECKLYEADHRKN